MFCKRKKSWKRLFTHMTSVFAHQGSCPPCCRLSRTAGEPHPLENFHLTLERKRSGGQRRRNWIMTSLQNPRLVFKVQLISIVHTFENENGLLFPLIRSHFFWGGVSSLQTMELEFRPIRISTERERDYRQNIRIGYVFLWVFVFAFKNA